MKIKLEVKYDGSGYCGWQVQPEKVSIQGVLEESINIYLKSNGHAGDILLEYCGRTDAGVSARKHVSSFYSGSKIDLQAFTFSVNGILKSKTSSYKTGNIIITNANLVGDSFHPRYSSHIKEYRYFFNAGHAFKGDSWAVGSLLNLPEMLKAAEFVRGDRDFSAFRASDCCASSVVRTILHSEIVKLGDDEFVYVVRGNGFLKQMVRILVGTLVKVGRGRMSFDEFCYLFEVEDRRYSGKTAPANALELYDIRYI